jgi:hypothetical protein
MGGSEEPLAPYSGSAFNLIRQFKKNKIGHTWVFVFEEETL